ncbi:EscU/YscU/HrcU family type III secretion system export apparatus switch protein [Burkholderia sp. Bp8986]|uniref:EscU/YscU/HrcU family type III secretion system export apparatus switch protein n=1 Tax=Burkholderia sp. Bp8986 TaxID=2184550 RepID=UPI000F598F64|nr:EscU/YscU/HrcU family type III secretion system export apparatus switch protein [Burkholderia sp. Bp8986]RQS43255.1 EscU/YscU/HrcU family type III secretion system export apparatus switch protein [Burkholderia sp. Bp8986]
MSEKTEAATPKRIKDARKQGQVAKTVEGVSYAQLGVFFGYVSWKGEGVVSQIGNIILRSLLIVVDPKRDDLSFIGYSVARIGIDFLLPLAGFLIIVTIFANLVQTGPLVASEAIAFDLKKLNPVDNLKKLFSISTLVQLIKSTAMLIVLTVLLVIVIKGQLRSLQMLPLCGEVCALALLSILLHNIFIVVIIFGVVVSFADFGYQKYKTTEDLKMTKDEVKRENKDDMGDPEIKQRRRELQGEMRSGNLAETVSRSSVVVRNPTHVAICLYYKNGETPVPKMLLKGRDKLALRIVELAVDSRVPIVEDVALAHALFAVKNGRYIPSSLYGPVALLLEALRKIDFDEKQRNSGASIQAIDDQISGNRPEV